MKKDYSVEELLRWRLARAEAEAPPAPRAARLIELARPWWETLPERFQSVVSRLSKLQVAYGHAMAEPLRSRIGHPIPVMIVRAVEEFEASARVLYLNVRDGRLLLRFQLEGQAPMEPSYEVTIISDPSAQPFSERACLSAGTEYRLDVALAGEFAKSWEKLNVTDRMPFRLILRSEIKSG